MQQYYTVTAQKLFAVLCALFLASSAVLLGANGDTIRVNTIQFGDRGQKQQGKYVFPPATNRYQKILMNYKLKCPPNRPCGEWDYLMYVYLDHQSGRMDSTLMPGPNFTVNGSTAATFSYLGSAQGWNYRPRFEQFIVRESTTREGTKNSDGQTITSIQPLNANDASAEPFQSGHTGYRSQYVWKKSELQEANVLAGNITGMQFHVTKAGSGVQRLTIRMKHTSLDALAPSSAQQDGFTTVFERNFTFASTGMVAIPFTRPFAWDGTSNIVVDIVQDNAVSGTSAEFAQEAGTLYLAQNVAMPNYYAQFDGKDYIQTPSKAAIETGTIEARFMAADTNGQHYLMSNDRDAGEDFPGYHLYLNGGKLYGAIWRKSDNKIMTISGGVVVPQQWYHAAMTFTGTDLLLYLDGKEVARATTGPTSIAEPAYNLMIGVLAFEAPTYYRHKGGIADVRVWKKPLSIETIREWSHRDIAAHPDRANLVAHYPLNAEKGLLVRDAVAGNNGRFMAGKGNWKRYRGPEYFSDIRTTANRPWTLFEQGEYTSRIDSVLVVDSTLANPVTIVKYDDFANPGKATDTLLKWTSYYRYTYDSKGKATDSTLVQGDATLTLQYHPYYSEPFEVVERYELMRYITPYGNGLNLGDGFTWTMDVTDYAPLLHDTVFIQAFNPQEDLELTFDMIEGIPARDVVNVNHLWLGSPRYGYQPTIDEEFLVPKQVAIKPEAKAAKLRVIQTGHGFGSDGNCAEFCDKQHFVKVNGTQRFSRHVWRDNCGSNPVYPQGGTWLYNRSNWCPGAEVTPFDYELTPYITPGETATIDVDMEAYTYPGGGSQPYYAFSGVLFSYGAPNFANNAVIEDIIAPTMKDIHRRQNPICGSPVIVVRNNGSQPLTSLQIEYGVRGGGKTTFMWSGNIPFLGEQQITLLSYNDWNKASDENLFEVWVKNPNGTDDEYPVDNYAFSHFEKTPVYYNDLEIRLRTNNSAAEQYEWTLKNADGALIATRANMNDNTTYVDSLQLQDGCYEFRLINKLGFGLDFWAIRSQLGSGSLNFSSLGTGIKSFGADFGNEIYHQFRVGQKPTIAASADTLQFGFVQVGKEKMMTVEVSPANEQGLVVSRGSVFLPNRGFDFVSSVPSLDGGPVTLKQGEKMTFTVAFRPTVEKDYSATLSILSNDQRNDNLRIPLQGVGKLQVSVEEHPAEASAPKLYLMAAPTVLSDESHVSFAVDSQTPLAARIVVVNSIGQEVATVFTGDANERIQQVALPAATLPAGVYYVVFHVAGATAAVPVTVVK